MHVFAHLEHRLHAVPAIASRVLEIAADVASGAETSPGPGDDHFRTPRVGAACWIHGFLAGLDEEGTIADRSLELTQSVARDPHPGGAAFGPPHVGHVDHEPSP